MKNLMLILALAVAIALSFVVIYTSLKKSSGTPLRAECIALKAAVQNYYTELGEFPAPIKTELYVDAQDLLPYLNGDNEQGIKYYGKSSVHQPFSEIYRVYMDWDNDGRVQVGSHLIEEIVVATTIDGKGRRVSSLVEK